MRFSCLLGLLLLVAGPGLAQSELPLLFREDFNDNQHEWLVANTATYRAAVVNGGYRLENRTDQANLFYDLQVVQPNRNYRIVGQFRQLAGVDNYGYGLVWGTRDGNNSNNFIISSSGQVNIYLNRQGKITTLYGWKPAASIKPLGEENFLEVRRTGPILFFLVNNQVVWQTPAASLPFLGQQVGFIVSNRMTVQVGRLSIYQKKEPIKPVPNPITATPENLGPAINTKYDEINPVIAPDGKTLYFTRTGDPGNLGGETSNDIWLSRRGANGSWLPATHPGRPLNNGGQNFVISTTPDNNTLLVGNGYDEKGEPDGDGVSLTHRTATGWEIPKSVVIKDYYNRNPYVNFSLGSDKRTLILCVERDDSYGDMDLYVSFRQADNTWSSPKNLGPVVNSFAEELAPSLAPDGKTLYYGSVGKPGYGNADIFVTRRLDSTWTRWSEPQNLGPAINSAAWESYFSVTAAGDYAYFVSTRNSVGKGDIFRIQLATAAKPQPVVLVKGRVLNTKTKEPVAAHIDYLNLKTGAPVGVANAAPADGTYQISLPAGLTYGFLAAKEGFLSVSDNLDLSSLTEYSEIERDLLLTPLEAGAAVRMNNVFFAPGQATLLPDSYPELDRLAALLVATPTMEIRLEGHTDNAGSPQLHQELSEKRVKAVRQYLLDKKIAPERIAWQAFGGTRPVADNSREETRRLNRRVEFVVVKL